MTNGTFTAAGKTYAFHDVRQTLGSERYDRLPYVTRVFAENLLRHLGRPGVSMELLAALADPAVAPDQVALPLHVPRVVLPDSSGIPVLMDLAALRAAVAKRGGDPKRVNATVPMVLIVDHSLQVDMAGSHAAEAHNLSREFERNGERYAFLKWAQQAFDGLRVFPPGSGIIHQIHLEQVAAVTLLAGGQDGGGHALPVAFPDFAIGGDSHTPMINALGVMAWGVGGIEIETVVLGEPYILPKPECVGVRLEGKAAPGITVTDIALTLTKVLRGAGVVGACVEFFGRGAQTLTVPDRATLANMAPEYGATTGFWPVDEQTLDYLRLTGRTPQHVALVEAHTRAAGLFRYSALPDPNYHRVIPFDLAGVRRTIAGPGMPHVAQEPATVAASFRARAAESETKARTEARTETSLAGGELPFGAIGIAAITSCTNTSNVHGMIRAGLLAKAAVERGLKSASWVKTSLAPGSRAVTAYLQRAELLTPLEELGFHVVGYGCTTCAGKSGSLKPDTAKAVEQRGRMVAAVLSGNRNFDGRIHRLVGANYLCSPALVVAYAIAGQVNLDIDRDPLAHDSSGAPVFLRDLWPQDESVDAVVRDAVTPDVFAGAVGTNELVEEYWARVEAPKGELFSWDGASSYIVEPPFFSMPRTDFVTAQNITGVRVLGIFGDNYTTDHASPGGEIPADSPAGQYLASLGVASRAFNSYVGRRGNHHVMARATYSNLRSRNRMVGGREGWWTCYQGDEMSYFEAASRYQLRGVPLVVLAGHEFGTGSSRDWAAKGPALLGVRAVIARSFERIHRSNLIGVGIVPLLFAAGDSVDSLALVGNEELAFDNVAQGIKARAPITVVARQLDGATVRFVVEADVRSDAEADLLMRGGMFAAALDRVGA
ncbi:MAG TPA: aconitate hydratase AcnA [Xanthobacteraceae bacterium]|nr:aconitate hydratase AcnA [Xanthobacteraceae bacterium]